MNIPESLQRFMDNPMVKKSGMHNIYHIQSIDRDGNVTSEAFGLNAVTWYGLVQMLGIGCAIGSAYNAGWPYYGNAYGTHPALGIILGTGTTEPTDTSTQLESTAIASLGNFSAVGTNPALYTMTYDPDSDNINEISSRYFEYVFDYNISGISEDFVFTEIGLNYSAGQDYSAQPLQLHSLVYDENGDPIEFTKHINEKLTIRIYPRFSMKSQVIKDMWNKGIRFAGDIHYPFQFTTTHQSIYSTNGSSLTAIDYNGLNSSDFISQSTMAGNTIGSSFVLTDTTKCVTKEAIESAWNTQMSGIYASAITKIETDAIKMKTPEYIECNRVYVDKVSSGKTTLGLKNSFGGDFRINAQMMDDDLNYNGGTNYGIIPANDFNITASYMYNHITKEWDISDTTNNVQNCNYGIHSLSSNGPAFINIIPPGETDIRTCAIYINPNTSIPITRFSSSPGYTPSTSSKFYATDEFWDTSTWVEITSPTTEVPSNVSTKRYYIIPVMAWDVGHPLYSYRDQTYHSLSTTTPYHSIDVANKCTIKTNLSNSMSSKFLSSDKNNWFMTESKFVYYPTLQQTPTVIDMPEIGVFSPNVFSPVMSFRWATDDRIVLVNGGRNSANRNAFNIVRVYAPSDDGTFDDLYTAVSGSTAPTWVANTYYSYDSINDEFVLSESQPPNWSTTYIGYYTKNTGYVDIAFDYGFDPLTVAHDWTIYTFNGSRYIVGSCANSPYTVAYLDIYGDTGHDVSTKIIATNAYTASAIAGTNYVVYHRSTTSDSPAIIKAESLFEIYDMSTDTVVQSFNLGSEYVGAVVMYITGFGDNIYVRISYNSAFYTFHYSISKLTVTYMNGFDDPAMVYTNNVGYMMSGCKTSSNQFIDATPNYMYSGSGYLYTADNPTSPQQYLFTGIANGLQPQNFYGSSQQIVSVDDGKHLLLICPVYGTGLGVVDLGYFLDTGEKVEYPSSQIMSAIRNTTYIIGGYYKNGIIVNSQTGECDWYPIEKYLPHKICGTTRTLQAWNNPKNIVMGSYHYGATVDPSLDTSKVLDTSDLTYGDFHCTSDIRARAKTVSSTEITITETSRLIAGVMGVDTGMVFSSYKLLTSAPSNWSSNYTNYFEKDEDGRFSNVSGSTTPTWVAGKYYELFTSWMQLATNSTTVGDDTLTMSLYNATAPAGTYAISTVTQKAGKMNTKLIALKNSPSLTVVDNAIVPSNTYSFTAGTGKRRLYFLATLADKDLYSYNETFGVYANMNNMIEASTKHFTVWYDPDTSTDTKSIRYRYNYNSTTADGRYFTANATIAMSIDLN